MSSTQIINDINKTLYKILRESVHEDVRITFGPPTDEDDTGDDKPRLFVFLYNIAEDPFNRGRPREIRGGKPLRTLKAPLGVNLYYMLTPFSTSVTGTTAEPPQDPVQAHTIIAQVMRGFYDNGIIDSKYFPASNMIGESQVRISPAQMNLEEITKIWSSFNKPFRLSVCYEVSIVYIQSEEKPKEIYLVDRIEFDVLPAISKKNLSTLRARGWNIVTIPSDGRAEIADIRPAAVRPGMALSIHGKDFEGRRLTFKIEGREIEENSIKIINDNLVKVEIPADEKPGMKKLTLKLEEEEGDEGGGEEEEEQEQVVATLEVLSPAAVRPGMALSIHGKDFEGRRLTFKIEGREIEENSIKIINDNLVKVEIPADEKPGMKKLTLKLEEEEGDEGGGGEEEEQEQVVATLEVLPAEPSLITITEIRPDPGRPGDLITVHGINFSEEGLEVSIDDNAATKTLVDNSQINVMIPGNTSPGTRRLTIKTDRGTVSKQFRVRRRTV